MGSRLGKGLAERRLGSEWRAPTRVRGRVGGLGDQGASPQLDLLSLGVNPLKSSCLGGDPVRSAAASRVGTPGPMGPLLAEPALQPAGGKRVRGDEVCDSH